MADVERKFKVGDIVKISTKYTYFGRCGIVAQIIQSQICCFPYVVEVYNKNSDNGHLIIKSQYSENELENVSLKDFVIGEGVLVYSSDCLNGKTGRVVEINDIEGVEAPICAYIGVNVYEFKISELIPLKSLKTAGGEQVTYVPVVSETEQKVLQTIY